MNLLEDRLVPLRLEDDEVRMKAKQEHEEELKYIQEAIITNQRRKELMDMKA